MKKFLSILLLVFMLLNTNLSFAGDFQVNTKLPNTKQESYKKQIDKVYKNFDNKLSKLSEEKQISNIEKIVKKIDKLLLNKLSDKNNFVLSYLNYLLKDKLDFIVKDDKINQNNINCINGSCLLLNKCGNTISYGNFNYSTTIMPDGKCWTTTSMKHLPLIGNSWCYDNNNENCNKYGRLYDYNASNSVCTNLGEGWSLPTEKDYLNIYGDENFISKLNLSGIYEGGNFIYINTYGSWWISDTFKLVDKNMYSFFRIRLNSKNINGIDFTISEGGINNTEMGMNILCTKK